MATIYPYQKKLFDLLRMRHQPYGRDWFKEYLQNCGVSKTPAYNRLRGQKPISLDEGVSIMTHYGISVNELFHPPSSKISPADLSQVVCEGSGTLSESFQKLLAVPGGKTYCLANDIPLLWLAHFKNLFTFRLYFWGRMYLGADEFKNNPFGKYWFCHSGFSRYMDSYKKVLDLYKQLPGVEFWSQAMFDKLFNQIDYLLGIDGVSNADAFNLVVEDIYGLIDELENTAEAGSRTIRCSGEAEPALTVFSNSVFNLNDMILGTSDRLKFIHYTSDGPNLVSCFDSYLVNKQMQSVTAIIPKLQLLSVFSEANRLRFFKSLRHRVDAKVERLKKNTHLLEKEAIEWH